jgi:hypothetical protein
MDELWIVTGDKEVYYPRVTDFEHEALAQGISKLSFQWKDKKGMVSPRTLVGNFAWKLSVGSYKEPPPTRGNVTEFPHPQNPPTMAVSA